jgi:PLP dependent protein
VSSIAERIGALRARLAGACARAGRDPAEVTLIAVAKRHAPAAIEEAAAAGVVDIGESYAQELASKQAAVRDPGAIRWHFVGRLQRNKVKQVIGRVALVHAVDSERLAAEIDRRAREAALVQPVLLAVNLGGEEQKSGVAPDRAEALAGAIGGLAGVELRGLMTMPPPGDPERIRVHFRALRELRDRLASADRPLPDLSIGMSGDLEVAVEEGATLVRVGTAIFGPRGEVQ